MMFRLPEKNICEYYSIDKKGVDYFFIKIEKYLLKLLQFVKICVIIYMYSGLDRAERLDRRLFSTGYVLDNF